MTVVGWTDAVDAAWNEVEDDYPLSFDWDFVPGWIIDHIDWSDPADRHFTRCLLELASFRDTHALRR